MRIGLHLANEMNNSGRSIALTMRREEGIKQDPGDKKYLKEEKNQFGIFFLFKQISNQVFEYFIFDE